MRCAGTPADGLSEHPSDKGDPEERFEVGRRTATLSRKRIGGGLRPPPREIGAREIGSRWRTRAGSRPSKTPRRPRPFRPRAISSRGPSRGGFRRHFLLPRRPLVSPDSPFAQMGRTGNAPSRSAGSCSLPSKTRCAASPPPKPTSSPPSIPAFQTHNVHCTHSIPD